MSKETRYIPAACLLVMVFTAAFFGSLNLRVHADDITTPVTTVYGEDEQGNWAQNFLSGGGTHYENGILATGQGQYYADQTTGDVVEAATAWGVAANDFVYGNMHAEYTAKNVASAPDQGTVTVTVCSFLYDYSLSPVEAASYRAHFYVDSTWAGASQDEQVKFDPLIAVISPPIPGAIEAVDYAIQLIKAGVDLAQAVQGLNTVLKNEDPCTSGSGTVRTYSFDVDFTKGETYKIDAGIWIQIAMGAPLTGTIIGLAIGRVQTIAITENVVAKPDFAITQSDIQFSPQPMWDIQTSILVTVNNLGNLARGFILTMYDDSATKVLICQKPEIDTQEGFILNPGGSKTISCPWTPTEIKTYTLDFHVQGVDEFNGGPAYEFDLSNNEVALSVVVSTKQYVPPSRVYISLPDGKPSPNPTATNVSATNVWFTSDIDPQADAAGVPILNVWYPNTPQSNKPDFTCQLAQQPIYPNTMPALNDWRHTCFPYINPTLAGDWQMQAVATFPGTTGTLTGPMTTIKVWGVADLEIPQVNGVSGVTYSPSNPTVGDPIDLKVTVKNSPKDSNYSPATSIGDVVNHFQVTITATYYYSQTSSVTKSQTQDSIVMLFVGSSTDVHFTLPGDPQATTITVGASVASFPETGELPDATPIDNTANTVVIAFSGAPTMDLVAMSSPGNPVTQIQIGDSVTVLATISSPTGGDSGVAVNFVETGAFGVPSTAAATTDAAGQASFIWQSGAGSPAGPPPGVSLTGAAVFSAGATVNGRLVAASTTVQVLAPPPAQLQNGDFEECGAGAAVSDFGNPAYWTITSPGSGVNIGCSPGNQYPGSSGEYALHMVALSDGSVQANWFNISQTVAVPQNAHQVVLEENGAVTGYLTLTVRWFDSNHVELNEQSTPITPYATGYGPTFAPLSPSNGAAYMAIIITWTNYSPGSEVWIDDVRLV